MDVTQRLTLPRGGLSLPCIGMGCAPLGGLYQPVSEAQARATLDGAWDAGVRFFDTAPFYGYTQSEHRLGAALRQRPRKEFVISTKVGRLMRPDASVRAGDDGFCSPLPFRPHYDYTYDGVLRSHDDSLQRLGLECIDILFVHDIGRVTHGEMDQQYWRQLTDGGGFRALDELRASGQVKAVGLGVNECEIVLRAMAEFDLDCTLLAGRYTLLEQASLSPLLDLCAVRGNAVVIGGPFNSGVLAGNGKFNYADAPTEILERVARLDAICREFKVPLQAAALQFPLAHPAVASCIPGGQDLAQLKQNLDWFATMIPNALWTALQGAGLIDARAPVPKGAA
ncbi:aldo/keto reductase [Janthinobacterium psychrotolerans]|uniref:D-threo-aldose 1-dehydrogenase n=1 Tax=Janthinobacterium psychrotolerans TaxID=1747903 RepID=A0A1A7C004_9BURK|nr:aldo/keto reductase [Janthinobacterium psychrotolerans]OBV39261.1 D-threo-aldose 1-dehydrogenase [Janthinobacterium psychrotolerans]